MTSTLRGPAMLFGRLRLHGFDLLLDVSSTTLRMRGDTDKTARALFDDLFRHR